MLNSSDIEFLDKNAPQGAFSTFDMEVMVPELEKLKPGDIYLEVGVDKGKSLSIARQVTDITHPSIRVIGVDLKKNPEISGTEFFQGDSVEVAIEHGRKWNISLLFIDGDHSYQGCMRDIMAWVPFMKKNGVILFHDCDESSPGVLQAVAEFVNTHQVQKFELFKRTDKNTSMAKVQL